MSGMVRPREAVMGLECRRRYLAKIQTVIVWSCLSEARPEYFTRTFLERSGPPIPLPSERVQSRPPFFFYSTFREGHERDSECIAGRMVKYTVAICIVKKRTSPEEL